MRKGRFVLGTLLLIVVASGGYYYSQYGFTIPDRVRLPWGTEIPVPDTISFPWGTTVNIPKSAAGAEEEGNVYAASVGAITGRGALGINSRYIGFVETQEQIAVNPDNSRKIDTIYVDEGDAVKAGDPLFSYDTEDLDRKIQEADLELEEMSYSLLSQQEQLAELQKAMAKAKESELPAYHIQVLSAENAIRRQQYNIASKQLERAQLEKSMNSIVVFSETDGIIKSLNKNAAGSRQEGFGGDYGYGQSGQDNSFITILKTGDYRIRGSLNEMNLWDVYTGEAMLVTPRNDEERVYHGTVVKVNTEPDAQNNQNYFMGPDTGESSSKYSFYVELTEPMDLMLGQHVIISPDTLEKEREGLWIPTYYIAQDEEGAYVWAAGSNDRIEKRRVETGDQDDENGDTRILDGLDEEDYIAFPEAFISEGMHAIRTDDPSMTQGGVMPEVPGGEGLEGMVFPEGEGLEGMVFPEGEGLEGMAFPEGGLSVPADEAVYPEADVLMPSGGWDGGEMMLPAPGESQEASWR